MKGEIEFKRFKILQVTQDSNETEKQLVDTMIKILKNVKYDKDGYVIGIK